MYLYMIIFKVLYCLIYLNFQAINLIVHFIEDFKTIIFLNFKFIPPKKFQ